MFINSVFDNTNIEVNFDISDETQYKIDEMHKIDEMQCNNLTNAILFLLFGVDFKYLKKKTIKN